jgi:hypothetical protein
MPTREALFKELKSAFERAERFRERMNNRKLFLPVQAAEFYRSQDESNRLIARFMELYPGEWSEAEQEFLRPL